MPYRKNSVTQARTEARQQSFLTAAKKLWLQGGIGGFTMAQVARLADSSVGNLYFYFPDKEALLAAVVADSLLPLKNAVDQAMDGEGRIHTRLALALHAGVRGFISDMELCRLCFTDQLPDPVDRVVGDFLSARLHRFLQIRGRQHYSAPFALACWHGSIRDTLRAVMAGDIKPDATLITTWLVRWNFLALGLDKATVKKVIDGLTCCNP